MQATWLDDDSPIDEDTLLEHGVFYQAYPTSSSEWQPALDRLKAERGYLEQDEVRLNSETPQIEALCEKFIGEHLHDDDEVRFVLDGQGIFDIRSTDDRWMHIVVDKGDLIIVPKARHHRFMLTDPPMIHCVRLFKDRDGWTPHYRGDGPPETVHDS